ncbi:hypothetical protein FSP39_001870 [Pinctada imbricata]|uniref:Uncharacterized protein n=1 Tax=Pinctada imbricata TaxID=66713 RepID=A0AA88XHB0_PINIB|nr:hypothetical protein FSP39_001870 [Pinctada imbricata]
MNIPGLVCVIVFYIAIFVIGIIAGRKKKSASLESRLLADRNLGLLISSCSFTASVIGGAYILGTAEVVGRDGLIWAIAPVFFSLSGIFIAYIVLPKIAKDGYTTMFDPIQNKFGKKMGALLFINELVASVIWEASILKSLGTTLSFIIDVDFELSVIASTCVAVVYTFFGGMYSVSFTDIIQFIILSICLVLVIPFVSMNEAVHFERIGSSWTGSLPSNWIGYYIDICLVCFGGGVPWALVYQGAFACRTFGTAQRAMMISTALSLLLLIPPSVVGIAGTVADWNMTSYTGNSTQLFDQWSEVFPMALRYLCPSTVSILGLAAISAAVMSSVDTIVLSTGGVFTRNIYQNILRPQASQTEILWVLRISVLVVGALGVIIAVNVRSIYALSILSGDVMYVAQFPQLICSLWLEYGNTYGSLSGFLIGLTIRILGGEPLLKIPSIIRLPFYDEATDTQLFPFRTFSMICSFMGIAAVSKLTDFIFRRNFISKKFDMFRCFQEENSEDNSKDSKSCRVNDGNCEETENATFLNCDVQTNM